MKNNHIHTIDKNNLYRLPWSMNDNPIGWVELTDICNIHCEGCYRLVMGDGHKPLEKVKREILQLKEWRNCDCLMLAGGEPILHPDIIDIVRFISEKKMKSIIFTNGFALTDALVKDLKNAGVTGFRFHIDSTQSRPEFKKNKIHSEKDLDELRLKYAKMVHQHGLHIHFGITVSDSNFNEIPHFIQWTIDNSEMVNSISLILYRGFPADAGVEYFSGSKKLTKNEIALGYFFNNDSAEKFKITSRDVYSLIKENFPDYEATSFLGGTQDQHSLKWLIGNIIVDNKGKTFGASGKRTTEISQTGYHLANGTYFVYSKKPIGKKIFFRARFDDSVRKALFKYLIYLMANPFRIFNSVNTLGIAIIQPFEILPDGKVNMCDDCPDMCVHEGKLVYSCRLDEYRIYGDLLNVRITQSQNYKIKYSIQC